MHSFNAALLHEPWEVKTGSGGPFKVYSPFWRACLQRPVAAPLPAPDIRRPKTVVASESLESWGLLGPALAFGVQIDWRSTELPPRRNLR